jgi:hypothetical protein
VCLLLLGRGLLLLLLLRQQLQLMIDLPLLSQQLVPLLYNILVQLRLKLLLRSQLPQQLQLLRKLLLNELLLLLQQSVLLHGVPQLGLLPCGCSSSSLSLLHQVSHTWQPKEHILHVEQRRRH